MTDFIRNGKRTQYAAKRNKGHITTNPSALVMAAMLMNHRAGKTVHKLPRVTEGPSFLMVPSVN